MVNDAMPILTTQGPAITKRKDASARLREQDIFRMSRAASLVIPTQPQIQIAQDIGKEQLCRSLGHYVMKEIQMPQESYVMLMSREQDIFRMSRAASLVIPTQMQIAQDIGKEQLCHSLGDHVMKEIQMPTDSYVLLLSPASAEQSHALSGRQTVSRHHVQQGIARTASNALQRAHPPPPDIIIS